MLLKITLARASLIESVPEHRMAIPLVGPWKLPALEHRWILNGPLVSLLRSSTTQHRVSTSREGTKSVEAVGTVTWNKYEEMEETDRPAKSAVGCSDEHRVVISVAFFSADNCPSDD